MNEMIVGKKFVANTTVDSDPKFLVKIFLLSPIEGY